MSFFTFFLLTCIFVPGLLASLEDLQHANTTLDSNRVQMPDTLGYRGDNNPYPPSVSSDFSQIEARCFETAYYMFMSQVNVLIPIHVQGNILILTGVHEGILILIHIQTFYSNPYSGEFLKHQIKFYIQGNVPILVHVKWNFIKLIHVQENVILKCVQLNGLVLVHVQIKVFITQFILLKPF